MEIRPLAETERKYTYAQSMQLRGQTGCIGYLRGDFGQNGNGFFTAWNGHGKEWETEDFREERDTVINALRSDTYGLLQNKSAMGRYIMQYPKSQFQGNSCMEYGFRAEIEKYAFLIRCNPAQGDYDFCCYGYIKERLDQHIRKARMGIRFINSRYKELFRIADGEKIMITHTDGEKIECVCRYIDECHVEVDNQLYHICQFAELLEMCDAKCVPVGVGVKQPEKEEKSR